jgi:tryptophanyl-tRNA synthetase
MNKEEKKLGSYMKRFKSRKTDKVYLCIEDGEKFTMTAKNWETAVAQAIHFNASVLCEVK